MARGDMLVENATAGSGVEILNRPPFEGVSMTIDFEGASDENFTKDEATGEYYAPAGIPIDKDGKPKKSEFTNIVGILLTDVYQHRPQGTIVTEGYINKKRAEASFGGTYTQALVVALVNAGCRIRIEGDVSDEFVIGNISAGGITGSDNVKVPSQSRELGEANGNKKVSDLISSDVSINWKETKGTPTGTVKYIENYGKPYEGEQVSGHFFPIKFERKYFDTEIQVGGDGGKLIIPTEDDPYLIIRVENVTVADKISAIVKDTGTEIFELDFSSITREPSD